MELLRLLEKASDNEKYKEQYKSDKKRFGSLSEVEEDPFVNDVYSATIFHLLGIDPDKDLFAPGARPIKVAYAKPEMSLLA